MPTIRQFNFLGVDWGTTHRRVYALDNQGQCHNEFADNDGALACKGRFPDALHAALQRLQIAPDTVVMSGMVGSALGWHEVPYLNESTPLDQLPHRMFRVLDAGATMRCAIVPGYCVRNAWGQPDVMRGEETQLLGAVALGHHSGWFVLPGTHSKWVQLQAGRIVQLRTYMTGELYELLGQHGTVAAAVGTQASQWSADAFAEGVDAAGRGALSNLLFSCRARVVCGDMPPSSTKSYLSGLLIGSELHDVLRTRQAGADHFKMICSPELAAHYQVAASQLKLTVEVLDAKAAFLAAMARIQSEWTPT